MLPEGFSKGNIKTNEGGMKIHAGIGTKHILKCLWNSYSSLPVQPSGTNR